MKLNINKIRQRLLLLALPLFLGAISSCSDDDQGGDSVQFFTNVVTFRANLDDGTMMFEYREINDSPLITLFAKGKLTESVAPGSRLLINYALPLGVEYPGNGTTMRLRSISRTLNASLDTVVTPPTIEQLPEIYLNTLTRSGEFINISATMPLLSDRTMNLVVGEASLKSEHPHLYLNTRAPSADIIYTYNSLQWGSLSIAQFWNRPEVTAVTIHVNNSNNPLASQFTFEKN